ncbi:flavodoxin family protein [Peptoniphilus stercorisuis]|uniref:Multimeric flavodoxin WrbA n=1 Tax=Peptoniphilus stercorisuis TaxID=1436965 RepID=A0ABS4KBG8_9FIRM|nr:flavodoxin family protein [Peptoniphilus stercorisuis]MBP2025120.1 multimeric flavodoxin WrbA [Peptoniphilus stercorisuis]
MKILAIAGSSRKNSNTDNFLDLFLENFNLKNEDITYLTLKDLDYSYCISCYGCAKVPRCILKDDLTDIYPIIEESDMIIFSTPIYFNSVSSISKSFIDRMQVYWSRKFLLKLPPIKEKFGICLINGGAKYTEEQFLGSELVFDHFLKVTSCKNHLTLKVSNTDENPINSENEDFIRFLNSINLDFNARKSYVLKEKNYGNK